ncbi:MAG TPA: hypothetical protein VJU87_12195 [Gemmatimonadaceae bacterium]|nr:hypothetical protein [Gemmatimonadaceae bacterium]
MRPHAASVVLGLGLALLAAHPAQAQWGVWEADSLLAAGRVAQAESLYYAASSASPRDPGTRAALGRYLAARGALRIGAVLLEESRLFGGDTAAIARALAPIYSGLADYRALVTLPRSPLSPAERSRARWLVAHPRTLESPDSVVMLSYRPLGDGSGLGIVPLRIGDRRVDAILDARVTGLVLGGRASLWDDAVRTFGSDSAGTVAATPELHLGGVTITNVPTRIDSASTSVRVGLDVLRRLAPTFDAPAGALLLRRSGQVAAATPGTRRPVLIDQTGMRVLLDGHWQPATAHGVALLLESRRWTLDPRRGDLVFGS